MVWIRASLGSPAETLLKVAAVLAARKPRRENDFIGISFRTKCKYTKPSSKVTFLSLVVIACLAASSAAAQGRFTLSLPHDDFAPSIVDASAWIEAPTGKHGFVKVRGEQFLFADGTATRFWGAQLNLFPKEQMDYVARRLRKQGINIVRMHGLNFLNPRGAESILQYDAAAFDRLDYAIAALGRNGVYIILDTDYPDHVPFGPKDGIPGLEKGRVAIPRPFLQSARCRTQTAAHARRLHAHESVHQKALRG